MLPGLSSELAMSTLPPGVAAYVKTITSSLTLLVIGAVWAAVLVPLLILLLFFSTPSLRRRPIFLMNLVSVSLGITLGIINTKLFVRTAALCVLCSVCMCIG